MASSTTTLIEDSSKLVIVDPGINRELLLDKLAKENIKPEDINYVFMTHYHPDHAFLCGIFPNADALDDGLIYKKDKQTDHSRIVPETSIEIIPTPGHDDFHASLKVQTEDGVTVVAGDVFWWADHEKQETDKESLLIHKDPFVKDEKALLESRKKLLEMADLIIPGHGKAFRPIKQYV